MCAGRKMHFVVRGQWTRGLTVRFEGGKQGQGASDGLGEKTGGGVGWWREDDERGKGDGRRKTEG